MSSSVSIVTCILTILFISVSLSSLYNLHHWLSINSKHVPYHPTPFPIAMAEERTCLAMREEFPFV
jgi:hypothetical protein